MEKLGKITDDVKEILEKDAAARDSDNVLMYKYLGIIGNRINVDFDRVSVTSFFKNVGKNGIPSLETVGRCRRKLQEKHPELRGSEYVERKRREREDDFRSYAREV